MQPIVTTITVDARRVQIITNGFGHNTLYRHDMPELWQWHEAVANAVANHHAQVMGQLLPCPEPKAQTPQAYVTEADTVFCANCWEEREQDPGDRDPNGWLSRQRDWGGSDCCESCGTEDGLDPVYLRIPDLAPKKHPDQLAQDLIDNWDDKHGPTEEELTEFCRRFPEHHVAVNHLKWLAVQEPAPSRHWHMTPAPRDPYPGPQEHEG